MTCCLRFDPRGFEICFSCFLNPQAPIHATSTAPPKRASQGMEDEFPSMSPGCCQGTSFQSLPYYCFYDPSTALIQLWYNIYPELDLTSFSAAHEVLRNFCRSQLTQAPHPSPRRAELPRRKKKVGAFLKGAVGPLRTDRMVAAAVWGLGWS